MNATSPASDLPSHFRAILEAATLAPSPDNNQPWKFSCGENQITVFLDRTRSLPSDESSMFDLTALGAAIENAVLAAGHVGYDATVHCLAETESDSDKPLVPIAELDLQSGGNPDDLYEWIPKRCTCRKLYSKSPLDPGSRDALADAILPIDSARIDWITDKQDKKRFGRLIAATDELRFRTEAFHAELYRQLRFTETAVQATHDGLDIKTLELPPGVSRVLQTLANWKTMQLVHKLRMTSLLTLPSKQSVANSSAIALISVPDRDRESFLLGARAIQRFWLCSAKLGLSVHPLGSLPIFALQSSPKPEFRATIDWARDEMLQLVPGIKNRVVQLAFRIGKSRPPSARSLRRPLSDVLIQPSPQS